LPHWLAQRHQRREQAGEELRLLYVAMTRARDTLILTGSVTEKKWAEAWQAAGAVTSPKILAAKSYADWLGLWFAQQPGATAELQGELPNLRWRIADDAELAGEKVESKNLKAEAEVPELDDVTLQKLREHLTWQYGFGAATAHAAKSSVTALRRQAADELDDEAGQVFTPTKFAVKSRQPATGNRQLSAADTGTAHHKFLQHVSLAALGTEAALAAEAERLKQEKVLSVDERAVLDLKAVVAFWNSDTGQKIRRHAAQVKRELAFTAKFTPAELSEIIGTTEAPALEQEFVVVQGVADLVVLLPEEIWLVDFKTDEIGAGDLPAQTKLHAPQLKLYARALAKIYRRPVTHCWLHFLALQHSESVG
jgi:ATP-dependent helicase/nuclease subunit A